VAWWRSRLLASKKAGAEYPARVLDRGGARALEEPPRLYVGTIHSFKGAEADCVILYPDLSPAGWREWGGDPAERDNVIRTFYVGITRAREELLVCARATGMAADIEDLVRG
jgi:superfamily I DNA/RNA helicase